MTAKATNMHVCAVATANASCCKGPNVQAGINNLVKRGLDFFPTASSCKQSPGLVLVLQKVAPWLQCQTGLDTVGKSHC